MRKRFPNRDKPEGQTPLYDRLADGEIRLLRLQPSSGHGFTRSLSGSLETIRVFEDDGSRTRDSPDYEALSYVWGSQIGQLKFSLNNTLVSITANLGAALLELSKGKIGRSLWIDAICINQHDLDEQNAQVQMMGSIYRHATCVIIWLGPSWTGGKKSVAEAIRTFALKQRQGVDAQQLSTFLDNPYTKRKTVRHWDGLKNYDVINEVDVTGGYWPVLVDFFDRPWWRRVWVRQELAMSQRALVQCGDEVIDWTDVAAISHWLTVWIPDLDEKSREWRGHRSGRVHKPDPNVTSGEQETLSNRSGAYSGEDLEYFRQTLAIKGEIDFETMLIHARNCESSDPRDKVYSIVGLTHYPIQTDYRRAVNAVAIEAFRKLTYRNNSLDALIWSQNPCRNEDTPSWAPNLASPFDVRPSRLKGKMSSIYNAGGSVRSQGQEDFAFLEDGVTLVVRGAFIFDSVIHLSPPFYSRHPTDQQLDSAVSSWRTMVFQWLGTMEIEQKYERLMSTLTRDRDIRGRRLPKRTDGLDWGTYFRVTHEMVGARTELEYLALAVQRTTSEGTANSRLDLRAWLKLCAESIGGRRIIMTSAWRIGLVPSETRSGDILCHLGIDVPFVLRKLDDAYIVIGEAYIHGAMDGEIFDLTATNGATGILDIKLK